MSLDEFISKFSDRIPEKRIAVLTGAGMSTASGIKDFRGKDGLYTENIDAETILSHEFFENNPDEFYNFFRNHLMLDPSIKPNLAHELIKEYEDEQIVNGIITQNIDGLHKVVGSKNVVEIHGNANKFYCVGCKRRYSVDDIRNMDNVPLCPECGNIIRPDIVLYNETPRTIDKWTTQQILDTANTLLVIGSTLRVDPIRGFVHDYLVTSMTRPNRRIFIVNQGETYYDNFKDIYKYDGDIIEVAKELQRKRF